MASRLQLPVEQLRVFAQNHIGDKYFVPLLVLAVAYALSNWVAWDAIILWLSLVILTLIPTLLVYQRILALQGPLEARQIQRWSLALALTRTPYLLSWSTMLLWAWVPHSNNNHLFLIIFNVGLIGATGVMGNTLRGMMVWEVVICSLPATIRYLIEGDIYYAVAFTSPFFFVLIIILGLEMHKNFSKMVNMQVENQDLIDELTASIEAFTRVQTDNERLIGELERLAREDALTHVHNRRSFLEQVGKAVSYARRHQTTIAIAVIDVDHFKEINDNYGHAAGDEVLASIAGILGKNIRESDSLGRLGGEEFAILFMSAEEPGLVELLRRLVGEVASRDIETTNGVVKSSISVGIAFWDGSETMESLINRADAAMYRAKNAGRNQLAY